MINPNDWVPEPREKFLCEYAIDYRLCRKRATWRDRDYLTKPDFWPAWLCDEHLNELKEKESNGKDDDHRTGS